MEKVDQLKQLPLKKGEIMKKYVSLIAKTTSDLKGVRRIIALGFIFMPILMAVVFLYAVTKRPDPILYIAKEFPDQNIQVKKIDKLGAQVDTRDLYAIIAEFIRVYDTDLGTNKAEILTRFKRAYMMCTGKAKEVVKNTVSPEQIIAKGYVATEYNILNMMLVDVDVEKGEFKVEVDYTKRMKHQRGKIYRRAEHKTFMLKTIDRYEYVKRYAQKPEYTAPALYGVAICEIKERKVFDLHPKGIK